MLPVKSESTPDMFVAVCTVNLDKGTGMTIRCVGGVDNKMMDAKRGAVLQKSQPADGNCSWRLGGG
eukprot:5644005-Pyramimonas_sp.AAC.1